MQHAGKAAGKQARQAHAAARCACCGRHIAGKAASAAGGMDAQAAVVRHPGGSQRAQSAQATSDEHSARWCCLSGLSCWRPHHNLAHVAGLAHLAQCGLHRAQAVHNLQRGGWQAFEVSAQFTANTVEGWTCLKTSHNHSLPEGEAGAARWPASR